MKFAKCKTKQKKFRPQKSFVKLIVSKSPKSFTKKKKKVLPKPKTNFAKKKGFSKKIIKLINKPFGYENCEVYLYMNVNLLGIWKSKSNFTNPKIRLY